MHLLRTIIRHFDDWLSHVEGVEPFTDEPRILLRLQTARAAWDIPLPNHRIAAGSPVLVLHFWNERIPVMRPQGADLEWSLEFQRRLIYSFEAVASRLEATCDLSEIQAVGGNIAQVHMAGPDGGRLLLERLGFRVFPYHRPAGAFGEFWENFYTWLLMWTYNPASLRSHSLLELQRNEFWMTREHFFQRFGRR